MQEEVPKPFVEHLQELRKLVIRPFIVMALVTGVAFWKGRFLVQVLQKPLGKTLYYSSPIGGINFIFEVALLCGFLVSLPLFIYSIIKFLQPVMAKTTTRKLLIYFLCSLGLATAGVIVGYTVNFPIALHFFGSYQSKSLQPLISANEYLKFTLLYLAGFAILFQLPLIISIINRIKPLKPRKLLSFKYQRIVILASFIIGATFTPTPELLNQLIFASPVIVLYQLSILVLVIINRKNKALEKYKPELNLSTISSIMPKINGSLANSAAEWAINHPIGATYTPQPATVEVEPQLRPIDIILSGSSVLTQS